MLPLDSKFLAPRVAETEMSTKGNALQNLLSELLSVHRGRPTSQGCLGESVSWSRHFVSWFASTIQRVSFWIPPYASNKSCTLVQLRAVCC